jgi:hypothetical protein
MKVIKIMYGTAANICGSWLCFTTGLAMSVVCASESLAIDAQTPQTDRQAPDFLMLYTDVTCLASY